MGCAVNTGTFQALPNLTCPALPTDGPRPPRHPQRPTPGAAAGPPRGGGDAAAPGRPAGPPAAVSRGRRVTNATRRDPLTIPRQSHIWGSREERGRQGSALPRRGGRAAG